MDIAVIGSGIAGLSCARRLKDAGLNPIVFDKGRGVGGRLATRRADGDFQFDHGAQMIPHETSEFGAVLEKAEAAGFVATWDIGKANPCHVGIPGMTGLAKYLVQGIDLNQATEIASVTPDGSGWHLHSEQPLGRFDRVVCTAPSPQTMKLVGPALQQSLEASAYAPCLTLMIALKRKLEAPDAQRDPTDAFAWIAQDSAKPGRETQSCWVVQASADWSAAHLELSKDEIATVMLDLFLRRYDLTPPDVAYVTAHRWRYALVTTPLGQPFVTSQDRTLYAGGDWCLGPRVEDAWTSGTAIANDILNAT